MQASSSLTLRRCRCRCRCRCRYRYRYRYRYRCKGLASVEPLSARWRGMRQLVDPFAAMNGASEPCALTPEPLRRSHRTTSWRISSWDLDSDRETQQLRLFLRSQQ